MNDPDVCKFTTIIMRLLNNFLKLLIEELEEISNAFSLCLKIFISKVL